MIIIFNYRCLKLLIEIVKTIDLNKGKTSEQRR